MMLWLLLFAFTAQAAPKSAEIWSLAFPKAKPVAVFFDAGKGALFVSVEAAGAARLDLVSLSGKLEKEGVSHGAGKPGALRTYTDHLYWLVGERVLSYGVDGTLPVATVPSDLGRPVDIAVGRGGRIFVGTEGGAIFRVQGSAVSTDLKGTSVTGLFFLNDTLYILRGTKLQETLFSSDADPASHTAPFCASPCFGLERTSQGGWLTTQKGNVLEVVGNRPHVLLATKKTLGRPAYVYHRETKDDFYVIPFPEEGVIRAYRHER